jgi:hypothetical protein
MMNSRRLIAGLSESRRGILLVLGGMMEEADVAFGSFATEVSARRYVRFISDSDRIRKFLIATLSAREAANYCSPFRQKSPPMTMMPPAIVVAPIPTVVVAATAVMAPPMAMSMTMSVAAFDLNHCPIGAAQRIRRCCGHSRRRHSRHEPKGTARKSDYQKPLHLVPPPSWQNAPADYQFRFCNVD